MFLLYHELNQIHVLDMMRGGQYLLLYATPATIKRLQLHYHIAWLSKIDNIGVNETPCARVGRFFEITVERRLLNLLFRLYVGSVVFRKVRGRQYMYQRERWPALYSYFYHLFFTFI